MEICTNYQQPDEEILAQTSITKVNTLMVSPGTLFMFILFIKFSSQTQTSARSMLQNPAVANSVPESQENFKAGVGCVSV